MPKIQRTTTISDSEREGAAAYRLAMQNPATLNFTINRLAEMKIRQALRDGRLRLNRPCPVITKAESSAPRMSLVEDSRSNKLTAVFELPGVKNSDISLQIHNGHLVVKGERKLPGVVQGAFNTLSTLSPSYRTGEEVKDEGGVRLDELNNPTNAVKVPVQELRFGSFHRTVRIPDWVQESDVSAGLQDGMLTVTWPKSPSTNMIDLRISPLKNTTSSSLGGNAAPNAA